MRPEKEIDGLDYAMLGTAGLGFLGEVLYCAFTGDTLPSGELAGFYSGFTEVGPLLVLGGTNSLKHFSRNRVESNGL